MKINQVLVEATGATVAFAFGRFNPAHQGHIAVWQAVENAGANWFVGTNPTTIGPNDPLTFEQKSAWMEEIYPPIAGHIVAQTNVLTLAAYIFKKVRKNENATVAYITDATDWAWSGKLLNQYNGVEGAHGYYKFAEIIHVPSPRVSSATALRDAARADDKVAFYHASGTDPKSKVAGLSYFDTVKQACEKYPLPVKKAKKVKESLNEFAPDGFNGGDDGEEFNPNLAKMAYDEGFVKGASLADGATTQRAMAINDWDKHDGGIYAQHFAKGFKAGRMDKIRHNNKQYNLNLKLMKDGSIRHGEQGVAEEEQKTVAKTWDQMTPKEKISGVKGRTVWNEKTQRYYTVFDVPVKQVKEDEEAGEVKKTGQLIPFPSGTTKVHVSDVYDWYKLGMVISDLDDADPKMFGQGAPQSIIAFGSEEEESKLMPLLKRLGLRIDDLDPEGTDEIGEAYHAGSLYEILSKRK